MEIQGARFGCIRRHWNSIYRCKSGGGDLHWWPLQICCQIKQKNNKWLDSAACSAKHLHPGIRQNIGCTSKGPPLICASRRLKWNRSNTRYDQSHPYCIFRPSKWFDRGWKSNTENISGGEWTWKINVSRWNWWGQWIHLTRRRHSAQSNKLTRSASSSAFQNVSIAL